MDTEELDLFRQPQPITAIVEQGAEYDETNHGTLLREMFDALLQESEREGNTQRFQKLRNEYSQRLLKFWGSRIVEFNDSQSRGLLVPSREGRGPLCCIRGEEQIYVSILQPRSVSKLSTIEVSVISPTEEANASFTNLSKKDMPYGRPRGHAYVNSKIKENSSDEFTTGYYVDFGDDNLIDTVKRTEVRRPSVKVKNYITDKRELDCTHLNNPIENGPIPGSWF